MTNDAEGDTKAGLTAVPRSGGGYTLPPTSIAQTSRADELYIVVRQVTVGDVDPNGVRRGRRAARPSRTSTTTSSVATSAEATIARRAEIYFIDQNRTIYELTGATAETKLVAETATCADVRAALPM